MMEVLTKRFWQDVKKTFDEAREEAPPKVPELTESDLKQSDVKETDLKESEANPSTGAPSSGSSPEHAPAPPDGF